MDELTDIEAALKLSSIYLDLNPKTDFYSLNILNALAMGNAVVTSQNEVNKELVPSEFQDYLSGNGDTKKLVAVFTKLLEMDAHNRVFTGR